MSRSWRRISFSRRSRFSSAVTSPLAALFGSAAPRSRLRLIQRTSVDSPIPRSPAISRCVRPLVCTRRTASSKFFCKPALLHHRVPHCSRGTLHFSEASPAGITVGLQDAGVPPQQGCRAIAAAPRCIAVHHCRRRSTRATISPSTSRIPSVRPGPSSLSMLLDDTPLDGSETGRSTTGPLSVHPEGVRRCARKMARRADSGRSRLRGIISSDSRTCFAPGAANRRRHWMRRSSGARAGGELRS